MDLLYEFGVIWVKTDGAFHEQTHIHTYIQHSTNCSKMTALLLFKQDVNGQAYYMLVFDADQIWGIF